MSDVPTDLGPELDTYLIRDVIRWRATLQSELDDGHLSAFAQHFVKSALIHKAQLDDLLSQKMAAVDESLKSLDELKLNPKDKPSLDYSNILREKINEQKRRLNVANELAGNLHLVILEMDQMIKDFNGK